MKDYCTGRILFSTLAVGTGLVLANSAIADNGSDSKLSNKNVGQNGRITPQKGAVRTPSKGGIAGVNLKCVCGDNADHGSCVTGSPGSTDLDCCFTVCTADPFCCSTAWDTLCVGEANSLCGICAGPTNDNCADRTPIFDGDTSFSNLGATTDGNPEASCSFFGDSQVGSDIWYNYTASTTGDVTVSLCGTGYDTKMAIYDGCSCPATSKLACNDDFCGLQSQITISAVAGNCYKIRIGGFAGSQGSGNINISAGAPPSPCPNPKHDCNTTGGPGCSDEGCCNATCAADPFCCSVAWDGICVSEAAVFCAPPCEVVCPSGATDEGEPCGSDTNGGCNSVPEIWTDIACGETVCGNQWAFGGTRDTDWYKFTLPNAANVTWTVYSQAAGDAVFLVTPCPAAIISIGAGNCPTVATASLSPGSYYAFVAAGAFDGQPCDNGNNLYYATLTADASCTPCIGDVNHNGVVDIDDLLLVIGHWGPCP